MGELLSLPVLRGARVVAGHRGLDREVAGVNVMEVPDIEAYVHPGEVLLTTLYPLRDDLAKVAELVRRLHAATLSALVVRVGRYVDHIPAAALDAADELGFPIIVVDTHIAFNDVISAVLAIVLADYGPEPGRAESIRERLTAVALTGGGLAEIARTLAGALDRHVAVVDAGGVTLGTGRPPTAVDQVEGLAARADRWRAALASVARCDVHAAIGTIAPETRRRVWTVCQHE